MGDPGSYSSLQIDPYFIERIDVLKGPSSVLYGRSNPGGLASLTTKRPQFTEAARIDLSYGSNDYKSLGFDVTGPLNENIAYRVVGVAKDADSQVDYVEETRYTLMPSLTLNLSEDTNLNLYAYLQHDPNGDITEVCRLPERWENGMAVVCPAASSKATQISKSSSVRKPWLVTSSSIVSMMYGVRGRTSVIWMQRWRTARSGKVIITGYPLIVTSFIAGSAEERKACMPGSSTICCKLNSLPVPPFIPLL